jgi:hypothetical protein
LNGSFQKKKKNRPNFRKRDSPLFSLSREIRKAITRHSEEREGQQFMAREQESSQINFRQEFSQLNSRQEFLHLNFRREFSQLNFRQEFSQINFRQEFSQLNFRQEFCHKIWRKLLANTISKFRVCCKFWRRVLVVKIHILSVCLSVSLDFVNWIIHGELRVL